MKDSGEDREGKFGQLNKFNNNKKHFMSFAKINKYFFYPFLCAIICMLYNYFLNKIISSNIIFIQYILSIFKALSFVFGGFLYIISYFQQKGNKINDSFTNRKKFKHFNNNKKNSKKKLLIILLISFLYLICEILQILSSNKHLLEERLYYIFFIPLFSKLILKEDIYKHHYLSLIISILGIIFLIIPICLVFEQEDIIANVLIIFRGISYSLALILIKYTMDSFYISPLKICLLIGIILIVLISFIFLTYSLIKYHDLSYFKDCVDFSKEDDKVRIIIYIIISFIFLSSLQILTFLVVFYFSPMILTVTDIISPMLLWTVTTIENGSIMPDVIMYPIGYFILLLSTLIYNEIIILNFCGLSKNTKKYVEERIKTELVELNEIIDNNEPDNDIDDEIETYNE